MNGKCSQGEVLANGRRMVPVARPSLAQALSVLLLCGGGTFSVIAAPESASDTKVDPTPFHEGLMHDQMTVRELMRLDAAQALMRLRTGRDVSPAPAATISAQSAALQATDEALPVLKAIYGVGQRLLAEVHWQGQSYIYLKGQASPAGRKTDKKTFMLKSIGARCVTLQREETIFELCLGSSRQEG